MKGFYKAGDYIFKLSTGIKIFSAVLILIFVFLMSIAISPVQKLKEFENLVRNDSVFTSNYNKFWDYPDLVEFAREKAYKEALLELAERDSIQLAVNLRDSVVCLYIKGVKIHQSSIEMIEQDRILRKLSSMQYIRIFSRPLKMNSVYASIVKEPVVIRHAPKDTLEAALNAWKPDTLIEKPAFVALRLEHGIELVLEQNTSPAFKDKWTKFIFYKRLGINKTVHAFYRFLTFRSQEYYPTIIIKIPVDELRAIYRALPQNSYVVIYK